MSDLGFITVAVGKPAYAELAVDLALSTRAFHDHPFALVTDAALADYVRSRYPGVFDTLLLLPAEYRTGHAFKFALGELTPYRHTVFIDADTLVLSRMDTLLRETLTADILMMGRYRDAKTEEVHHGFSIRGLMKRYRLERYFDNHSGAFAFEVNHGRSFLRDGADVYMREMADLQRWAWLRHIGDELAFGIVGGRRGVTIMSEPFPVYWPRELQALTPDNPWKPLCHFHTAPSAVALDWMMREVGERRRAKGFAEGSEPIWRAKSESSRRKVARGEWLLKLYRRFLHATRPR